MSSRPTNPSTRDASVLVSVTDVEGLAIDPRLAAELVAFRQRLHEHPELSWEERETTAAVADRLRAAGLEPRVRADGVGLVCDVRVGSGDGPVIALRADLDALPLDDHKDVPYRSRVPGVCHACGHDVHTTAALGAGLLLAESAPPDASGTVRLVFQPAEEALPSGAATLAAEGAVDGCTAALALHCDPSLEVGRVGVVAGPVTAAYDLLQIALRGPGGHTARPHLTADLVHVVGRLISEVPAVLGRRVDARSSLNITFGHVEAGHAPNVIPDTALLQGTIRSAHRETWQQVGEAVEQVVHGIAAPYGAEVEVSLRRGSPPVENDPALTAHVAHTLRQHLGAESVVPTRQSVGGEDFSWLCQERPGCYLRLGVAPVGSGGGADLHSSAFDVAPEAVPLAARVLALAAEAALTARRPT